MVEAEAHSPEMKTSGGTGAIFGNVCLNEQSSSWCEAKVENGRYSLQASHSTEIPSIR